MHKYVYHRSKLPLALWTYFDENKKIHQYILNKKDDFQTHVLNIESSKMSIKLKEVICGSIGAGRCQKVCGPWRARQRESITGVWGLRPQRGPGGRAPGGGSGGKAPLKLKPF